MCAFANPLEIDNHNKTEAGAIMEVRIELDADGESEDDEEEEDLIWGAETMMVSMFHHPAGKILEEKDGNDIGRIQEVEDIL